jgi:hypothetical protein
MIVTFCYGRDVVESVHAEWANVTGRLVGSDEIDIEEHLGQIPEKIAARLWFLFRQKVRYLDSCMQYRGNAMPMVSSLLVRGRSNMAPPTFAAVEPGDFELAVTAENIGNIYACPAERIEQIRRSLTARKAVRTRQQRQQQRIEPNGTPPLLAYAGNQQHTEAEDR